MAKPAVFDSTAVLAVLYNEPGASQIVDLLQGGLLSSVNLAEIHLRLLMDARPATLAWNRVLSMGFEVVPFSEEQARLTAELFEESAGNARRPTLCLAERACLALAIERKATVYTTNPAWKRLPLNLDIDVIG